VCENEQLGGMGLSRSFPFDKLRVRISPGGSDAAKTAQDGLFRSDSFTILLTGNMGFADTS
jgi:hypothetical protein